METSACMYDFIVHVPELCGYLPKHSKKPKTKSKIKCLNYSGKKTSKFEKEKSSSKANSRLDGLDQMLSLIESTYKNSSILSQYKNLLLKTTENRKSQQLAKEFVEVESDSSLLELLTKLSRKDQVRDEDEDQKNNE